LKTLPANGPLSRRGEDECSGTELRRMVAEVAEDWMEGGDASRRGRLAINSSAKKWKDE